MKIEARDAHHETDAMIDRLRRSVRVKTINDTARVPRWIIRFGKAAKRHRRRPLNLGLRVVRKTGTNF